MHWISIQCCDNPAMHIDQIAIALLGAAAAWLSQDRRERFRRWACIFGILGQPFWFYAAWRAQQWGIFAVCVLYAVAWMRGLWEHWIRPKPPEFVEVPRMREKAR